MTASARHSRIVAVVLLLSAALLAAGCARRDGADVDAVRGYLDGLPAALHADTLEGIAPYATDEEIDRVRLYVAKVVNDGFRMEATLEDLAIRSADSEGSSATVLTEEDWSIRFVNSQTGAVDRVESYRIEASYHLIRLDDGWLVSEVEETDRVLR